MNFDELRTAILKCDEEAVANIVIGLSEDTHADVKRQVKELEKDLNRGSGWDIFLPHAPEYMRGHKRSDSFREQNSPLSCCGGLAPCIDLVWFAVGTLTEVKKRRSSIDGSRNPPLVRILNHRRPSWLGDWLATRFRAGRYSLTWSNLAELAKAGAYVIPDTDDAALFVSQSIHHSDAAFLVQEAAEVPGLLQLIYRFVDVETVGIADSISLATSYSPDDLNNYGWLGAIRQLVADGRLDRGRILDGCLRALARPSKQNILSGWTKLHDLLQPTVSERVERIDALSSLLSNQTSLVVSFAMEHIVAAAEGSDLSLADVSAALGAVFQCKSKGPAQQALKLLRTLESRDTTQRRTGTMIAIEGLLHPAKDVQAAALKLIKSWAAPGDDKPCDLLESRRSSLASSLVNSLDEILHVLRDQNSPASKATEPAVSIDNSLKTIETEIESIPEKFRSLLKLRDAVDAAAADRLPEPPMWSLFEVPVLTGLQAIEPVQSLDELFDLLTRCLEKVETADDVERILDGISRLCDLRPSDFDLRAAPLLKRIKKLSSTFGQRNFISSYWRDHDIEKLVTEWLSRSPFNWFEQQRQFPKEWQSVAEHSRWLELLPRVHRREARPLLSAPTHSGGWIEPAEWIRRLHLYRQRDWPVEHRDFVQSLLRLAPDRRMESLPLAKKLEGRTRDLAVLALGGEVSIERLQGNPNLWVAACRAREPHMTIPANWPIAKELRGPDAREPAKYTWGVALIFAYARRLEFLIEPTCIHTKRDPCDINPETDFCNAPELLARWEAGKNEGEPVADSTITTTRLHLKRITSFGRGWRLEWEKMNWPASLDWYWRNATEDFASRADSASSSLEPYGAYLTALLEPDVPLTELAVLALWIATLGKDADSRTMAIEVWIETIADGRANPDLSCAVLSKLHQGGLVKLNRLVAAMHEVAQVSALHAWIVANVLERFVVALSEATRDLSHVLDSLLELLTSLSLRPRDETLAAIARLSPTGKGKASAMQVAHLQTRPSTRRTEALNQLLEARMRRASRWSGQLKLHGAS